MLTFPFWHKLEYAPWRWKARSVLSILCFFFLQKLFERRLKRVLMIYSNYTTQRVTSSTYHRNSPKILQTRATSWKWWQHIVMVSYGSNSSQLVSKGLLAPVFTLNGGETWQITLHLFNLYVSLSNTLISVINFKPLLLGREKKKEFLFIMLMSSKWFPSCFRYLYIVYILGIFRVGQFWRKCLL